MNPQSADEVRFAGVTLIGYSPAMAAAGEGAEGVFVSARSIAAPR